MLIDLKIYLKIIEWDFNGGDKTLNHLQIIKFP